MDRITIELEAVTATFLHVEPESEARWRAAPFRGLARWWFRAVAGAALEVEEVRQREDLLFGTAEKPSRVVFRVAPDSGALKDPSKVLINPSSRPGRPYQGRSSALPPGASAQLEIAPADGATGRADLLQAYAALWVALHLGGVGQRSRRGGGSLRIRQVAGVDGPTPVLSADAAAYASQLARGLREVRELLGAARLRPVAMDADYPILHPNCARVRVVEAPWGGRSEEEVRCKLMDGRRALPSHRERRAEREFGGIGPRIASPLWMRVAAFDARAALTVMTLLRHRGASGAGRPPDWNNAARLMDDEHLGHEVDLSEDQRDD